MKKGVVSGVSLGFLYLTMFAMYAVTFWYGVTLVIDENDPLTAGDMMVVFFCILLTAFALGTVSISGSDGHCTIYLEVNGYILWAPFR